MQLQALRVASDFARCARSRGRMERNGTDGPNKGASRRVANAKGSMRHTGKQPERRMHAVRTYIPQVGYLFYCFDMYERGRQSAAQQHSKNNENETKRCGKKYISPFAHVIMFCLIETPCTGQKRKKIEQQSFSLSLVRRPPFSRPPRHRCGPGKASLPICDSEPRRPPRVKPGAHRGPRSPARQCWCSDCVHSSLCELPLGCINEHRLNYLLQTKTTVVGSHIT